MSDQDNYGRFTQGAWNFIKSVELTGEEADQLRFMIEAKTETITLDEIKAMVYTVVREKNQKYDRCKKRGAKNLTKLRYIGY